MRLDFDLLEIEYFRSFRKRAIIDFALMGPGLHFIRGRNRKSNRLGSNGAGKSSIFDALVWCLFGETVRGLKGPDIRPWSGKKKTCVYLEFFIDKKRHTIERTAGPNSLSLDGREVSQAEIDKLIGVSLEVFLHTILLGQSRDLFFDLKPKAKLDLFVDVLDLTRWDRRSELASQVAAKIERDLAKTMLVVDTNKARIAEIAEEIDGLKKRSGEWEDSRASRLKTAEDEIAALKKNIAKFTDERDAADLAYDGAGMELGPLATALDDLFDQERRLKDDIAKGKADVSVRAAAVARINAEIAALKEDNCPTCRRPMTDHKTIKRRLKELEDEKADFAPTKLGRAVLANVEQLEKVEKRIGTLRMALVKFRKQQEDARDVLDRLGPRIAGWQASITELRKVLEGTEGETNPYAEQIRVKRKEKEDLSAVLKADERWLAKNERKLVRRQVWIKGFKEIRLYIIKEVLQELEVMTNSMLDEFGLDGWEVLYEIEKEKKTGGVTRLLNVFIKSPDNDKMVKWESWSGGESQRLRIVGALALAEVLLNHAGVTPSLEVLDEPTRGLSVEGVRDLCDMLADRGRRLDRRLLLIDHHAVESSRFASTLTITKGADGSRIDQG